ncbi:hypothetical protein HDU77_003782 [Chytriomyces hyalinus]|nr:hypothetical protein HDU77_003782 [Chytriomyces hyalinus]
MYSKRSSTHAQFLPSQINIKSVKQVFKRVSLSRKQQHNNREPAAHTIDAMLYSPPLLETDLSDETDKFVCDAIKNREMDPLELGEKAGLVGGETELDTFKTHSILRHRPLSSIPSTTAAKLSTQRSFSASHLNTLSVVEQPSSGKLAANGDAKKSKSLVDMLRKYTQRYAEEVEEEELAPALNMEEVDGDSGIMFRSQSVVGGTSPIDNISWRAETQAESRYWFQLSKRRSFIELVRSYHLKRASSGTDVSQQQSQQLDAVSTTSSTSATRQSNRKFLEEFLTEQGFTLHELYAMTHYKWTSDNRPLLQQVQLSNAMSHIFSDDETGNGDSMRPYRKFKDPKRNRISRKPVVAQIVYSPEMEAMLFGPPPLIVASVVGVSLLHESPEENPER